MPAPAPDRDRDPPWIFRTYAGHSSARASNELFRANLAAGQTGLSIAFDLPTQCGYDPDHPLARPEVGKVGVPIASLDDMHALFEGIPLEQMNTSMTINGTAMWLLALYVGLARERGVHLDEIDGDGDEVEPSFSPDCRTLWFRRGTQILRAVSDSP